MATLYVENVPDELYEAVRAYARKRRTSIAAEVLTVLEQNFPSEKELKRRRKLFEQLAELRASASRGTEPFVSTEEMQREDRER
jgi:plasmid stability protein